MNIVKGTLQSGIQSRSLTRGPQPDIGAETIKRLVGTASPITAPFIAPDLLSDFWEGFTGREKTLGSDVLKTAGVGPGPARAVAGFGLDVAADPLTYVGFGLASKLGRGAKTSIEALRGAEESAGRASQELTEEISRRAAQEATARRVPVVPTPGSPSLPPGAPPRVFAAGPAGEPPPTPISPRAIEAPQQVPTPNITEAIQRTVPTGPLGTRIPRQAVKPLSIVEVANIKNNIAKGLSIEQAADRPLTGFERRVIQEGIDQGLSAKNIRNTLHGESGSFPLAEQLIEEIPTAPRGTPTTAVVGTGDTIATPVPKAASVSDLVEEVSGTGINWRRMMERQLRDIPEDADRLTAIRALESQAAATRSPVFKNMINQQIRKLREGVTPAGLIDTARVNPPEFPVIRLSRTRRTKAQDLADDFMRANTFENIDHRGQTNLFNRIKNWVNAQKTIPAKAKNSELYQMLRVAEDRVLSQGRKLVDSEGHSVRLTDIANLAGGARALSTKLVDDFRKAKPVQAAEVAKAVTSEAIAGEIIDPIIQTASRTADDALRAGLPPSRTVQLGDDVTRELENIAKQAGVSSKEAGAAKRFMEDFFNPSRDVLYNDFMKEARHLVRQSVSGKVDAKLIDRLNKATYDALQANPKVLGKSLSQSKVVEAIMSRFATWWGAKDLRPFAREYIDSARNVASALQRSLAPLVRSTKPSQRTQAWRVAQGKVSAGNAAESELANRFQFLIEKLVGAHDVRADRAVAESVMIRSGTTMSDINKELPARLQFKNTKGKDDLGRRFDYSGENWMHSWREWDIEEPAEAIYQLTRSLQIATRKNSMLDDAAARWGVPAKGGEFQHQVTADRLQGFYFPKEIADQLNRVWNKLEKDKFFAGPPFLQFIDKVQRMWKTGVTIYSPSHHIRNLNGDLFLSALDGVTTTAPYRKSLQILHAHGARYSDLESVFNIMDPELRRTALQARPGKTIVTTKAGHTMTAEQVYQAAEGQGFLLRAAALEDLLGGESAFGTFGPKFAPLGGRGHQTAARASEMRDHFVRMAHFIDVLGKSRAKSLRDAITEAGRRVKKWHPDGSDLTGFEQSVMRRLIPFYSWLRKSTPLIFEGLAMRPHVTMLFPKAMANLQEVTGIESEGPGNPFPMDQMFPDWIKEKGIGPIISPESSIAGIGRQETWRGEAPGYVIINPTNPFTDQISELANPRRAALSAITPFIGTPVELATGQTSLGIPLEHIEGGTAGHLAQQIPPVGIGARVTGMTRPDEPYHPEQLINWLATGGLVRGTGPYRSQAQIEIREALAEMGRKNREALR